MQNLLKIKQKSQKMQQKQTRSTLFLENFWWKKIIFGGKISEKIAKNSENHADFKQKRTILYYNCSKIDEWVGCNCNC